MSFLVGSCRFVDRIFWLKFKAIRPKVEALPSEVPISVICVICG